MSNSVGTNVKLLYVDELTWGVTPATGVGQQLRVTSVTPQYNQTTTQSQELTTAREIADYIKTDQKGGLQFNHEWSYGNLDGVMESLFGGSWNSNVLKVGNTRISQNVELGFSDINQYCLFKGSIANQLSLTIQRGQILNGQVGYSSKAPAWGTTSIVDGSYITNGTAPTNSVMDPIAFVQVLQEGGSGSIAGPQECSFTLSNGLIEFPQLGSADPADLQLGQFKAEGTFTTYFADRTYVDKVLSYVDTSLKVTIGGASSKKYEFLFSKIKLNNYELTGLSVNNAVLAKISWGAKVDATATTCQVTRTP